MVLGGKGVTGLVDRASTPNLRLKVKHLKKLIRRGLINVYIYINLVLN